MKKARMIVGMLIVLALVLMMGCSQVQLRGPFPNRLDTEYDLMGKLLENDAVTPEQAAERLTSVAKLYRDIADNNCPVFCNVSLSSAYLENHIKMTTRIEEMAKRSATRDESQNIKWLVIAYNDMARLKRAAAALP